MALVLKVHPSNYRIDGFVEDTPVAELATLGVPVVVDLGSGLLDATHARGWPAARRRGWPTSRPPSDPRRRRRARHVQRRQAARRARRPGSSPGGPTSSRAAPAHPLARALRPGGLVLAALQDVALAYLRRDA